MPVPLLASLHCEGEVHLVVGASSLLVARLVLSLESGASPILVTHGIPVPTLVHDWLTSHPDVRVLREPWTPGHLTSLGRPEVDHVVDRVFIVLPKDHLSTAQLAHTACARLRIPINTADSQALSSFTFLALYRLGDFALGVSTGGKGCRLAARIKRELVAALPSNIDQVCARVGELRAQITHHDAAAVVGLNDDDATQTLHINAFVPEFRQTADQQRAARARWLAQVVEYYPLAKLAEVDVDAMVAGYRRESDAAPESTATAATAATAATVSGSILLVGAGPGSVELLTIGALQAIQAADLVLADKLVPAPVLLLVPRNTPTFIARKFPGNAEAAQQELLERGLTALREGKRVVRLKQGDPYIFGRGGEEYLYFRQHGFTPSVIAGVTSALAAPTVANIPATQREVADQVLICTGTGRRGVLPVLPEWVSLRTTVFLMALHRVMELVPGLVEHGWPADVPVCIVERALCADQRVTRTTLGHVVECVEAIGSRPPGLMVVGHACGVLASGSTDKWVVEEGLAVAPVTSALLETVAAATN